MPKIEERSKIRFRSREGFCRASLALFISYVERARVYVFVYVHVARAGARSRPDIIKKHPLKTSKTHSLKIAVSDGLRCYRTTHVSRHYGVLQRSQ